MPTLIRVCKRNGKFSFLFQEEDGVTSAVFGLEDNESTRKMWNYSFKLLYEVTVGKHHLKTTITAENKGIFRN